MKISILLVLSFLSLSFMSYAASDKENYELQEKCGKRAEEYFKRSFGTGISTDGKQSMLSHYTNHFNSKLNKCFILVTTTIVQMDKPELSKYLKMLSDINENKNFGNFSKNGSEIISICNVLDKGCYSESEWDSLVKPYMEE